MVLDKDRRIALIDLDAFFSSIEQLENPNLLGKPVLIGGHPKKRGVVAAASYEARKYGCRSAMPMAQALRACPHATILPVRHELYREYSTRIMRILNDHAPVIEQVSIDEAYVDLTPISRTTWEAETIVSSLRCLIHREIGLSCSVGLANSKMMAKVACESGKPNGFVVIHPGEEQIFLQGLGVQELPGIGPRYTNILNQYGFYTLGQIATAPPNELTQILGQWGGVLQHRAQGQDYSPVRTSRETKSMSREETFPNDVTQFDFLRSELDKMSEQLVLSLQRKGLSARTVTLKLRFGDYRTITRTTSLIYPTSNHQNLLSSAETLLGIVWDPINPIRLIGLSVSNLRLVKLPEQIALIQDAP
jgi:DNA polymerase-4